MTKKKDEKLTKPEDVQEQPADQELPKPDTLPSEAETAPESSGSEPEKEEKVPPAPPQKKKKSTPKEEEIRGLMGVKHVPGPPGSWHG